MKKTASILAVTLAWALFGNSARAEVTLPHILSSHGVLQRDRPIHIWGWASPGESVVVSLHGVKGATRASDIGEWSVYLPPEPAGGPYTLTVAGVNRIVLTDMMVGDVWFASGQSNMQLPLMGFPGSAVVKNGAEEIANATHPDLRLLHFPNSASPYPQEDQGATWTLCTPKTAATFSAVAYFFAREIARREHVTVGIIDSSWGGTPGEAWISMDTLGSDAALMPVFAEWARISDASVDHPRVEAAWKRQAATARAAGKPAPWHPWQPDDLRSWEPSWLYNGMVAPAINFPIRGVIWYQGAQNTPVERAAMYQRIFPALIGDWRRHWRQGNFPFLFVQLANFTSVPAEDWAVVREAQRRALGLADTAMAVTIDIGDPGNVHYADKQDVGHRLALAALALSYGSNAEYSGPLYRQANPVSTRQGPAMRIWFDHAASGLLAKGGPLTGFEIAGPARKFVAATARIDGETVLVSSPAVPHPAYVRYGWANSPAVNLYNGAGLPASPFTTEEDIPRP